MLKIISLDPNYPAFNLTGPTLTGLFLTGPLDKNWKVVFVLKGRLNKGH